MTLKKRSYSAVRWTTTAAISRAVLQLVQIAVLARLLAPEEYGLMAIVGVVLSFAALFADFGLNSAYVQRQEVSDTQRSSLFWVNIIFSLTVTLIIVLLSPLIANLFDDSRLTPLLMLSSASVFGNALGQQIRMTAEKSLNFRPIALIEISAMLLGFISAIAAALSGMGVYSLVLGSLINAFCSSLLAWSFISYGWRPHPRISLNEVKPFFGFGGAMIGNNMVNQLNMNLDVIFGGKLFNYTELGLYSVPRNLILQLQFLINPIITRVGFPLIAMLQDDIPRVRSIYLKTINMTASTNAPLYIAAAFFAPELIELWLGPKWTESAHLLSILSIWGFLRSAGNPVGSLLFGMGRADLSLKWNILLTFVLSPILWMGASYGPEGLAWSLIIFSVTMYIPSWYILVRPLCNATLKEYTVVSFRPLFISIVSIAPAYYLTISIDNSLLRILCAGAIATPCYAFISYKLNREWFNSILEFIGKSHLITS